jgi:acyl-CoA synthetase (AMP-forming)/AMP-acid ligase II
MERHPTGLLAITPIQLREVLLALPAGFELKSGWRVVVSGAAMTPALARTARSRLTPDIIISYGATESGRACVGPASLLEANPGAIGWPVPGAVVEVVGPDGQVLPVGEQGEIRVRSERISSSYVDNPEASAKTFRDGYVYPAT